MISKADQWDLTRQVLSVYVSYTLDPKADYPTPMADIYAATCRRFGDDGVVTFDEFKEVFGKDDEMTPAEFAAHLRQWTDDPRGFTEFK